MKSHRSHSKSRTQGEESRQVAGNMPAMRGVCDRNLDHCKIPDRRMKRWD